jgi:flagellar basal body P-ring formation protein FlgA
MKVLAAAATLAMLVCTHASATSLRTMTMLSSPNVLLSDLFDGAPDAARVLGPAPAPGQRIVVEAPQLAAIARQFGVPWKPVTSGDRAVLERSGRPLAREKILQTLTAALVGAGAQADASYEFTGFTQPLVPPEGTPEIVVSQLDWDAASGRFTALLAITADGMDALTLRISGRSVASEDVLIAAHRLEPGDILHAADVRVARVHSNLIHGQVARDPKDAIGRTVRHAQPEGQPLQRADLVAAILVVRQAPVLVELEAPGLTMTAEGQALESGGLGDRIRVLNTLSHAIMLAEITGDGRVRIEPGSLPVVPAGQPRGAYASANLQ